MRNTVILILGFLMMTSQLAMGQVEDVDKKAKKKSEKRLNKKIDNGIDKGLNAIEGLFGKKKKKKGQDDTTRAETGSVNEQDTSRIDFGGIFEPAKVEDSYLFKGSVKMEIVTTSKKGKEDKMNYNMLIPSDADFMGFSFENKEEAQFATTIWDYKNESMVTMMEDEKGERSGIALAMKKDMIEAAMERAGESEGEDHTAKYKGTFEKTGKTKKILGYTCYEYKGTYEEGTSLLYFAEEDILDSNVFLNMFKSSTKSKVSANFGDVPSGFMMEMIGTQNDGSSTHMLVKEIDKETPFTMVPKDYNMMDMQKMMNRR